LRPGALVSWSTPDLAAESADLQSLQTTPQLGIQALSIANQDPGTVLARFR
jgi:flagellin